MIGPKEIETVEPGYDYLIPMYVVTNEGIVNDKVLHNITFCRGDISNPEIPRQNGVFVESLLHVCIERLTHVNVGPLATRETALAITKLQEATMWLEKRSNDRKARLVEGTYQK